MDDSGTADRVGNTWDDAKDRAAAAMQTATDLAGKAQTAATDAASKIQGAAGETVRQVRDATMTAYGQGAQAAEYVSRNTAEQPLLALLIAAAVGYGVAYIIHGR